MSLLRQCQSQYRFWISQTDTSQMNTSSFLHAFIVNVKLCAGWIDLRGNPMSVCMSFNFLKQSSSPNGTIKCFISVNMPPLSDFFEIVKFYGWIKFPLTAKGINVPGMPATMQCHTLIFWGHPKYWRCSFPIGATI